MTRPTDPKPPASFQRCHDWGPLGLTSPCMQCGGLWHDERLLESCPGPTERPAPAPPEQPAETGYGDPKEYWRQGWQTVSHEEAMRQPPTVDVLWVDRDQAGPSLWMIRRREQPARGDGVRRVFEGMCGTPDDGFGHYLVIDKYVRAYSEDWLDGLEGKRVRVTVTVLDDAPGKDAK